MEDRVRQSLLDIGDKCLGLFLILDDFRFNLSQAIYGEHLLLQLLDQLFIVIFIRICFHQLVDHVLTLVQRRLEIILHVFSQVKAFSHSGGIKHIRCFHVVGHGHVLGHIAIVHVTKFTIGHPAVLLLVECSGQGCPHTVASLHTQFDIADFCRVIVCEVDGKGKLPVIYIIGVFLSHGRRMLEIKHHLIVGVHLRIPVIHAHLRQFDGILVVGHLLCLGVHHQSVFSGHTGHDGMCREVLRIGELTFSHPHTIGQRLGLTHQRIAVEYLNHAVADGGTTGREGSFADHRRHTDVDVLHHKVGTANRLCHRLAVEHESHVGIG